MNAQDFKEFEFIYMTQTGDFPDIYISSENLYLKEMVVDPAIRIKVRLSKKQRELISTQLKKINFLEYPEVYRYENADTSGLMSTAIPCRTYTFILFYNRQSKIVKWSNCITSNQSKENKYENLRDLAQIVGGIIYSNKKVRKSKRPRAMYL